MKQLNKVEIFSKGLVYVASRNFRFDADPLIDEGTKGEEFIFEYPNLGFAHFKSKKDGRKVTIDAIEAFKIMRQEILL